MPRPATTANAPAAISAIAATMAMARRPASCDRPPDSWTIAVRGGLEFTANAPISAASMLPTPTAAKSRLTFSCRSGSVGNERTTAAVCIMQTRATISDSGSNCVNSLPTGQERE